MKDGAKMRCLVGLNKHVFCLTDRGFNIQSLLMVSRRYDGDGSTSNLVMLEQENNELHLRVGS